MGPWGSPQRPHIDTHTLSDRQLCAQVQHNDTAAFSALYDRYAPLIFTLLGQAEPTAAEALLEEVFVAMWLRGRTGLITEVVPVLIELTERVVAEYRERTGRGTAGGSALLPGLEPFAILPAALFPIFVCTCVGKLSMRELSVALACDQQAVRQALAAGFPLLQRSSTRPTHGQPRPETVITPAP